MRCRFVPATRLGISNTIDFDDAVAANDPILASGKRKRLRLREALRKRFAITAMAALDRGLVEAGRLGAKFDPGSPKQLGANGTGRGKDERQG